MSELVTSLRAVSWRVRNGEDVPPMEKALIDLCSQAADEITRWREAAAAVTAWHTNSSTNSKLIEKLREMLSDGETSKTAESADKTSCDWVCGVCNDDFLGPRESCPSCGSLSIGRA